MVTLFITSSRYHLPDYEHRQRRLAKLYDWSDCLAPPPQRGAGDVERRRRIVGDGDFLMWFVGLPPRSQRKGDVIGRN